MSGHNTGTDKIFFIHKDEIINERWKYVSYSRIVCNKLSQKEEVNRTRLTFGGGNLQIDMYCGTPTSSLLTTKLLLDIIISTPGAKLLGFNLKDFYPNTLIDPPYFLRIKLSNFPEEVTKHYKLREKVYSKGFLYVNIG